MVTRIGEEDNPAEMLEHLMALEYDAIEAYEEAIEQVQNASYKIQLDGFKGDHERHVHELESIIRHMGGSPASGPGLTSVLTKGRAEIADIGGDKNVLQAMLSNEEDTNAAYEAALGHAPIEAQDVLKRGRDDERRHWEWINSTVKAMA